MTSMSSTGAGARLRLPHTAEVAAVGAVVLGSLVVGAAVPHTHTRAAELVLAGAAGAGIFFALSRIGLMSLVVWAALAPILYPFVRYPRTHPVVTFDRIWLLGALSCIVLERRRIMRLRVSRRAVAVFGLFVIVYGLRALTTSGSSPPSVETWLDAIVLPFVALMLAASLARTTEATRRVAGALTLGGAAAGAIGIAEQLLGFQLATLSGGTPRVDTLIGFTRVSGPYPVPEVYALVLLVCLAATCYWIQSGPPAAVPWGYLAALLEVGGIAFTFFRVAWISVLLVIVAATGLRGRVDIRRIVAAAMVLGIAAVVYTQLLQVNVFASRIHNTQTIQTRFAVYHEAWAIFRSNPLFGVGVNNYTRAALDLPTQFVDEAAVPYPHSSYLGLLAEQGIVGFIPFVLLTLVVWRLLRWFRRHAATRADRALAGAAVGAALAYVVMSLGLAMLPYGPSSIVFALFLGLVVARTEVIGGEPVAEQRHDR